MRQRRLDYIDSLRGLAAVGVLVFHLRVIATGGTLPTSTAVVYLADRVLESGVPLFFTISGFLLAMLMPSYDRHPHPVAAFYLKRLFRIAPLFYAAILLWFGWAHVVPTPGVLAANLTFTFNFIPSMADSAIFAGWTIGVEMVFYAVFPLLHAKLPGIARKVAGLLAALVLAQGVDSAIAQSGLEPRYALLSVFHSLPMFVMGMLTFDLSVWAARRPDTRGLAIVLVAASAFVFSLIVHDGVVLVPSRYWQGLASALLLLGLSLDPLGLVNRATAFVGRISYSIYLLHGFVIVNMGHAFRAPYRWGLPHDLAFAVAVLMALAVVVPLSWLTFRLIETPGNRLGGVAVRALDVLSARRSRRGRASAPAGNP